MACTPPVTASRRPEGSLQPPADNVHSSSPRTRPLPPPRRRGLASSPDAAAGPAGAVDPAAGAAAAADAGSPLPLLAHRLPKLYRSPFFSLRRTRPLFPHVDVSTEAGLDAAVAARAFRGEIVVACFDAAALRWMLHFGRMLQARRKSGLSLFISTRLSSPSDVCCRDMISQRVCRLRRRSGALMALRCFANGTPQALGYDHFLAMGADGRSCDALRAAWCAPGPVDWSGGSEDVVERLLRTRTAGAGGAGGGGGGEGENEEGDLPAGCGPPGHPYPGCAVLGDGFDGEPQSGGEAGDGDGGGWRRKAWAFARLKPVERLWLARYHVAALLLRRRVNVLMSDLDGAPQSPKPSYVGIVCASHHFLFRQLPKANPRPPLDPPGPPSPAVVVTGDLYEALKSPPASEAQFIQMPGASFPNGGLWCITSRRRTSLARLPFCPALALLMTRRHERARHRRRYVHNAHPSGPAVRMLEEAVDTALQVLRVREAGGGGRAADPGSALRKCSWVDQDALK